MVQQMKFVDGKILFVDGNICMNPECCCGGMTTCECIAVTVFGLADNGCSACGDLNTTYYLTKQEDGTFYGQTCSEDDLYVDCTFNPMTAAVEYDPEGGEWTITVTLAGSGFDVFTMGTIQWSGTVNSGDCAEWNGVVLTEVSVATKCSTGSGSTVTVSYYPEECPDIQCLQGCKVCAEGAGSNEYAVTLSGLTDGSCSCSSWNGSFVLTRYSATGGCCYYRYYPPSYPCTSLQYLSMSTCLVVGSGSGGRIVQGYVRFRIEPGGPIWGYWTDINAVPMDCDMFNDTVLTIQSWSAACGTTGTVKLTSLP